MDILMSIFGALLVIGGLAAQPGDGYTWQPVSAVIVGAVFVVLGVVLWWKDA